MDHVDLYQIHRWDYETPIEETLEAMHDVVKAGKARYIGASSMYAWQFAKALGVSERNGWTRFVSMQNLVNLLYREEEREMLPLCAAEGIGVIPYSPLARGSLTRDFDAKTTRTEVDDLNRKRMRKPPMPRSRLLSGSGRSPRSAACHARRLRWPGCCRNPTITAPIIGATKVHHLEDALGAVDVKLTAEEIASLEKPYAAQMVTGPR